MKKLLALLSLVGLTSTANAAVLSPDPYRIEVSGIIDAGVLFADNLGNNKQSGTIFLNSPNKTSRLTIRASQDLGNGLLDDDNLRGGFHLEQQILPGDGSQGQSSGTGAANNVFGLAANLWLEDGKLGRITLGRQDSVIYNAQNKIDTRGGWNFGSSLSFWCDGSAFGGTATKKTGINAYNGGNQHSNAIRYDSPDIYGFKLAGEYAPGGVAGNEDASSKQGITVMYSGVKDLLLVAGQMSINDSTGLETGRTTLFGGSYQFDKLKLAAGYEVLENPSGHGAANTKFNLKETSMKYNFTDKFYVTGGVYKLSDDINHDNGATQYSLVADYWLSKNMDVYAGYATVDNKGGMGMTPYGNGQFNLNSLSTSYSSKVTVAGQQESAVVLGMMLYF